MSLNLISPICNTGYGLTGTQITVGLIKKGVRVSLFPIGKSEYSSENKQYIEAALRDAETFSVFNPCVRLWHQHDMSMFVGHGAHIGFPVFELDTFTPQERHHLSSCDKLFVCSKWAQDVIGENNINIKAAVVPLGVDTSVFSPAYSSRPSTVFLHVGKWEVRKGHDVLPIIFSKAFTDNDNVELWLMPNNYPITQEEHKRWHDLYSNCPLYHKIRILNPVPRTFDVARVMQQADCGLFPARGEGWNLELLEMMACGKHVITTNYSGHTEFCNDNNSYLVSVKEKEPAIDKKWFYGQGNWAKLTPEVLDGFVDYMRLIHKRKQSGNLGLNESGLNTANKFTWENTCEKLISNV